MKAALLALGLLAAVSATASAGTCDTDLPALNAALAGVTLDPDTLTQLRDMQKQAEKLCAAGNVEEAADVLSEASALMDSE